MAENSILSPVSLTSYFDNATGEARQANLFFYRAQTLDPITVYTDALLRIPFPQPVVTTGWGRVPPVYIGELGGNAYRVRAFDQYQTLIEDLDSLPAAQPDPADVAPPTPVAPSAVHTVGDIKLMWSDHTNIVGWLECDGKTIGNVGSNAGAIQSADAHDLFIWLWENDLPAPGNLLQVLPTKGGSAQGDWDALKQIALPDYRGRFLMGLDGFKSSTSSSETGRADAGKWDLRPGSTTEYLKPWEIGATGGESVHQLVVTELAVHFHEWIDRSGHTHSILEPNSGQGHKHTINQSQHRHSLMMPAGDQAANYALVESGSGTGLSLGYTGRVLVASSAGAGDSQTDWFQTEFTNAFAVTGIALRHANYYGTGPGAGGTNMHIGTWVAGNPAAPDGSIEKSGYWHNATENQPRATDYFDATQRGDKPHNTLPPFATVCVYIYFGEPTSP